ncbi:MAG: DUF4352 domain-containing protein [Lachnospiraceae bacterium]|nr:DUF4352 domain-containing protein [Lachnospiraceae bacterium]
MKRFFYALAGVAMTVCLVGCGIGRSALNRESEEIEESREIEESEDTQEIKESLLTRESEEEESNDEYYNEGRMGDTMETYFFDYTVNSAYVCDEYEGYQPQEGNRLMVADVTVKNTFNESIIMFDTDFQVQWNSDAEEDWDVPITYYGNEMSEEQLPSEYELTVNEERSGLLVFEVPDDKKDFSISYLEVFDDDSEGNVFFVYFTANMQ